jgi:DNA topoisomerase IA
MLVKERERERESFCNPEYFWETNLFTKLLGKKFNVNCWNFSLKTEEKSESFWKHKIEGLGEKIRWSNQGNTKKNNNNKNLIELKSNVDDLES